MIDFHSAAWKLLPMATVDTLYMVLISGFFAIVVGLPLGVYLTIMKKGHLFPRPCSYKVLEMVVNVGRSFPFAILMVALIPFTRWLVGTSLGTAAAIVPLTIGAIPFVARVVESALQEIGQDIIQAALVMGSTTRQIIFKVMIPEALPGLISAVTITLINLVGYSAMAGLIGGGGLGKIAIQYGYQRFDPWVMIVTVILLLIIVELIQGIGDRIIFSINKKRGTLIHV